MISIIIIIVIIVARHKERDLEKKHNNSKENLSDLSQKINTDWAEIEFAINFGHIN